MAGQLRKTMRTVVSRSFMMPSCPWRSARIWMFLYLDLEKQIIAGHEFFEVRKYVLLTQL
jgi:hypothetical protein